MLQACLFLTRSLNTCLYSTCLAWHAPPSFANTAIAAWVVVSHNSNVSIPGGWNHLEAAFGFAVALVLAFGLAALWAARISALASSSRSWANSWSFATYPKQFRVQSGFRICWKHQEKHGNIIVGIWVPQEGSLDNGGSCFSSPWSVPATDQQQSSVWYSLHSAGWSSHCSSSTVGVWKLHSLAMTDRIDKGKSKGNGWNMLEILIILQASKIATWHHSYPSRFCWGG